MPLPPAVIQTFIGTFSATIGKISEPLAKTIIAIALEYGPRAQAEAQIKRAVAKVAPYALSAVSTALAFAIASVGMKTQIRGGFKLGSLELVLEGKDKKPKRKTKPGSKRVKGQPKASGPSNGALRRIALPK